MPKGTYANGIWTGLKIKQPEGYFQLGEKLLNELKKHPEVIGQVNHFIFISIIYFIFSFYYNTLCIQ